MQFSGKNRALLHIIWMVLGSCSTSSNDVVYPSSRPCLEKNDTSPSNRTEQSSDSTAKKVTFYGDILPILTADSRDRSYKCTTCHAHYGEPQGLNNVPEIESIVKSLTEGRMPRSTTKVKPTEIELFTVWRLQGFAEGKKSGLSLSDTESDENEKCRQASE